jgi:hypothetical protein
MYTCHKDVKNVAKSMTVGQTGLTDSVPVWHPVMNSIINKTYIYGNHPKGVNHTILIKCT